MVTQCSKRARLARGHFAGRAGFKIKSPQALPKPAGRPAYLKHEKQGKISIGPRYISLFSVVRERQSLLLVFRNKFRFIMSHHSTQPVSNMLHIYNGLIQLAVTGADASCIYLESFSFSLFCTIEYTHTVLPNFHIVTEHVDIWKGRTV
jgi:hypothetical protein